MADKFHDKCGLFGVIGDPDAVALTLRGLSTLQHRGRESAGIAYWTEGGVDRVTAMGTVATLSPLVTSRAVAAIGHVRYGTCGSSTLDNAQPLLQHGGGGAVALAHNGHVLDLAAMDTDAERCGIAGPASDSGRLAHRVASRYEGDLGGALQAAFRGISPAYSVVVLTDDAMAGIRDPFGMRPLSIGRKGGAFLFSSETCALDAVDAHYVRDVEPGEIVVARDGQLRSLRCAPRLALSGQCIFELIYFARADSKVFGHDVARFRIDLGARLAREAPAPGDIVVPVPDSAVYGALGFARTSGVELSLALFKNDLVGRSFIQPTQVARAAAVTAKLNPISSLLAGRRVILVDDSIVRGTTCKHLVARLRDAGAREVHVRITSPPTIASCYFGVDTPDDRDLFATGRDARQMRVALGADSLEFLSHDALLAASSQTGAFCSGCFSGTYPIAVVERGGSCGEGVALTCTDATRRSL